jgi:hypothetical protein
MTAAALATRQHHKRTNDRLFSSVMGHTMPDGHMMRPTDRIASYRQQSEMRHQAVGVRIAGRLGPADGAKADEAV